MQTTINESGKLGPETVIASDVCECCPTSSTVTSKGPAILYRNRTEEKVRDMYFSIFSGGRMQPGRPVHADGWKIDGCPTNSGSLTVAGDEVAAAWFTGANRSPRINLAFSQSEHLKEPVLFEEPILVDGDKLVGRVALTGLQDHSVIVTWLGHGEHGLALRARQAWADGRLGTPFDVVAAPNGKLGFPFVAAVPHGVMSVWTESESDRAGIRAALVTKDLK